MVQELGIVPRYLDWLCTTICGPDQKQWIKPDDQDFSINFFGMLFLNKNQFQIGALVACLKSQLNQFLSWCIGGTPVTWETQINNYSLSELSTRGNIFLRETGNRFRLWFPGVLLHLLAQESNESLLQKMVSFPPSIGTKWKKFELMSLGLVVVRNNLYVEEKESCSIQELFPGAIANSEVLNFVIKLVSLNIGTEQEQWIHTVKKKEVVQTGDSVGCESLEGIKRKISFSKDKYALLCAPGTALVDARIHFLSSDDKPVIVVLQMKDTSSGKYLNLNEIQKISKVIDLLKKHYVDYKIICGVISNRPFSEQNRADMIKLEDFFLISKDQMLSFAPTFEHRFLTS